MKNKNDIRLTFLGHGEGGKPFENYNNKQG